MATVTICKACGSVIGHEVDGTGKPTCGDIFCVGSPDHNIPVKITVPDVAHCSACGQVATYQDGNWLIGDEQPAAGRGAYRSAKMKELPFYEAKDQTYYCGCRGWE